MFGKGKCAILFILILATVISPSILRAEKWTRKRGNTVSGIAKKERLIVCQRGPFQSIEEVTKVGGIGPKIFQKIRGYITVKK